jgi:murein DD-endopeptidase MepM/ murein hydrolase activator NlpD
MTVLRADLRANEAAVAQRRAILADLEAQAARSVQQRQQAEAMAASARGAAQSAVAAATAAQRQVAAKKAQEERRLAAQEAETRHLEDLLKARAARLLAEARARAAREAAARRAAQQRAAAGSSSGSASSGSSSGDTSSGSGATSSGGGAWSATGNGFFSPPVPGPITSPYGMRFHPVLHVWKLHDGTDFGAACGTPIHAGASGTVVWAQYLTGYGNQLAIDHGIVNGVALTSSYSHQERFAVSVGQHVTRGQVIGYTGETGFATGCHVHFMVYVNGATVNPIGWL